MRLASLDIAGLRSIDNQILGDCGNFNVLIGKNNSGKSNLLSAIGQFFSFLAKRELAIKRPPLGVKQDFYRQGPAESISLRGTLNIDAGVLQEVYGLIAAESPQVKQAIPVVGASDVVDIELEFLAGPDRFGYIKAIRHRPIDGEGMRSIGTARTLLELPTDIAGALASRAEKSRLLAEDASILDGVRLDPDEWVLMRRGGRGAVVYGLRELSQPRIREIQGIAARVEDPAEASRELELLTSRLRVQQDELESEKLPGMLTVFAGEVNSVPEHIKYLLQKFGEFRVLHLIDRREPIGRAEAGRLLQLKMSRGGGETLKAIQQTVSSLLGVEIDAFASDAPERLQGRRNYLPDAELDVDEFLVQVNGSGIREALRLVLDLEFQRPDLLLVEEPEIHLHPALEVAMMRYLKSVSMSTQVFLTTHSTNFLDTGDMRNIYMIQKNESTLVRHLNIDDAESEIPKELGIRLSSIFMFDRLIFVEGISDELVLRAFAQSLGYNLGQANVGFVVMGGARNFTHYAAQATISLLTKRQVKSLFVLDRDEREQIQIEKLLGQLGGQAGLHVLKNREIENYLLDPVSLADFIGQKSIRAGLRAVEVGASEVAEKLPIIAENLRETTLMKRVAAQLCGVHRVDRNKLFEEADRTTLMDAAVSAISDLEESITALKSQVSEMVHDSESEISGMWESHKMSIAPGHEILDNLLKEYGLRFNKDRDSGDLALLIPKDRIPSEIKEMLRTITS
ncbi:MAG TPA: AAA family ATPase [Pseudonocardiaceae bacterium]|nr:AAA family ATPase [Pseudonocardiaceae bacterium]